MKKVLITLLITAAFFHTHSQVIISNDKMNIVYAGVENPMSFSVNGYDSKKLVLIADCGEIRKNQDNFTWKICNAGNKQRVIFSCYLKTAKNKKLIGQSEFRLGRVPDPVIHFGSGEHGPIKFLNQFTKPEAAVEDFDFDVRFKIKQFDFEFFKANGDTIKLKSQEWEYSPEIIAQIEDLKEGERFCLKNFVVFNECEEIERKLKDTLLCTFSSTKPIPQW